MEGGGDWVGSHHLFPRTFFRSLSTNAKDFKFMHRPLLLLPVVAYAASKDAGSPVVTNWEGVPKMASPALRKARKVFGGPCQLPARPLPLGENRGETFKDEDPPR